MAESSDANVDPLFTRMVAEGHGMFSLAALDSADFPDLDSETSRLIDMAVQAGVLGALSVLRDKARPV